MRHRLPLLLCAFAIALAPTVVDAAAAIEFPTPGVQIVDAQPGGSGVMSLVIRGGDTPEAGTIAFTGIVGPGSARSMTYTSVDPSRCTVEFVPGATPLDAARLIMRTTNLAAGEMRLCEIRVDRPASARDDDVIGWITASTPVFLTAIIGERVAISAQADLVALESSNGAPAARVRITTTNNSSVALNGLAFSGCGSLIVEPAPSNGCPAFVEPAPGSICFPGLLQSSFASPPLPAGGSSSCEVVIRVAGGGPLPESVQFVRAEQLAMTDGRLVFDISQVDNFTPLLVRFGITAPVPTIGFVAMVLLALALALFATRRLRPASR